MLFAISFAVPAMGGPSLGNVYKVAKKALKTGNSANSRAKTAQTSANTAQTSANTAQSTADTVRTEAVTLAGITTVVGPENTIYAYDVASSIAFCPSGSKVVSGGGFSITGAANGMAASEANDARTAWFVVGGNTSSVSGSVQAVAYCAASGQAVSARNDRSATRREVASVEAKVTATLRK